jgi:hypothetical protein
VKRKKSEPVGSLFLLLQRAARPLPNYRLAESFFRLT